MLLGFYSRFVPKIESGIKIHTMRDLRKYEPKIGEKLHMYTGGYNESRRLITNTHKLFLTQDARVEIPLRTEQLSVHVDDRFLFENERSEFVINDGFDSIDDFTRYWLSKLKKSELKDKSLVIQWCGKLHHWTKFKY